MASPPGSFEYDDHVVSPGNRTHLKYEISETYLSDPISVPVTIVNGSEPGPTAFLAAAVHGDELNGVEVVRHVADELDHRNLHGTLVCLHVVNVPGFNAQERYIPIADRDLNRAFPGSATGDVAERIAQTLYDTFVRQCDLGVDFHTSTRGRTNQVHVRGDLDDAGVDRLARSFAAHVVLDEVGPKGSLRRVATGDGIPTITVEMGEANRFQRPLVDQAVAGVRSVLAEFGLHPDRLVRWPGWRTIIAGEDGGKWLRADAGGIVEMHVEGGDTLAEGDAVCTITNPFDETLVTATAPFRCLVVGVLEDPVVYPGNPLCHLIHVDESERSVIRGRRSARRRASA